MNEIMQVLHRRKKGPHVNTIERFHIHTKSITNNHLNDDHTIFPNAICNVLLKTHHPQNCPNLTTDDLNTPTTSTLEHTKLDATQTCLALLTQIWTTEVTFTQKW